MLVIKDSNPTFVIRFALSEHQIPPRCFSTAEMTELSFAKSFLSTLDSRPIKLQSDYVADPKTFEPKGPVSLLRSTLSIPLLY